MVRRPSVLSSCLDSPGYLGLSNMPLTPTTPLEKRAGTAPEGRIRRAVLRNQGAPASVGFSGAISFPKCLRPILKTYRPGPSYI